ITASICSSVKPVSALTGSNTTGRNHPSIAGASSRWHSQYRITRSTPILRCSARHLAYSSAPTALISLRLILSIKINPPAVLRLSKRTPRNQASTSHSIPIGCSVRDPARGARGPDSPVAFWVDVSAHVVAPSAPVLTAGFVCARNHVNVMTGDASINTSAPTASAYPAQAPRQTAAPTAYNASSPASAKPPAKSTSLPCSSGSPLVLVQKTAQLTQLFLGRSPALQRVDHQFACRAFKHSLQHVPDELTLRLCCRLACLINVRPLLFVSAHRALGGHALQ